MIIGISGVAGSGKDTLADMLVKRGCAKVALADPLKRVARDVFDFSYEQLWGPSAARNEPDKRYPREHTPTSEGRCACCGFGFDLFPMGLATSIPQCYLTPRYALQTLGTEWGRHVYKNVWIDYLIRTAEAIDLGVSYSAWYGLDPGPNPEPHCGGRSIGVPDVRFKNEIDALIRAGAYLIRITRAGAGLGGAHVSETEQSEIPDSVFNMVVENSGTLEELKQTADLIYEGVLRSSGST